MNAAGIEALKKDVATLESDLERIVDTRLRKFREQTGVPPTGVEVEMDLVHVLHGRYDEWRVRKITVNLPDDYETAPANTAAALTIT